MTTVKLERTHGYDLGVLLVHGIGHQRRGETLVQSGGELVESLAATLGRGDGSSQDPLQKRPTVKMTDVNLAPAEPSPASIDVTLVNVASQRRAGSPFQGQRDSRWLVAESWWAESFPDPSFREIFRWTIDTLPVILVSHFDRRVRRAWFEIRNPDNFAHPLGKYFRFLLRCVGLGLALLLVPPLLLLLTAVLLLGFLPIPFAGNAARWIQRQLAVTIGDSYVLLSKEVARGQILGVVRRDVRWLAERCERVAIVAHSQGGAIAHEVVRTDPLIECHLLLTYGSGLNKLALLQRIKAFVGSGRVWVASIAIATMLASVGVFLAVPPSQADGHVSGGSTGGFSRSLDDSAGGEELLRAKLRAVALAWRRLAWPIAGVAVLIAALALGSWLRKAEASYGLEQARERDRERFKSRFQLPNYRVGWVDIYSSDDPVPNGPLLDDELPRGLATEQVWNLGSTIGDHTTYWRNRDTFVSRLAATLLGLAGIDIDRIATERADRQHAANLNRRWRVSWRSFANWIPAATAAAIGVRLSSAPPPLAAAALESIGSTLQGIRWLGPWLVGGGESPDLQRVALIVAIVLFALFRSVLGFLWSEWNAREAARFPAAPSEVGEYRLWEPRFLAYAAALGLLVAWALYAVPAIRLAHAALAPAALFLGLAMLDLSRRRGWKLPSRFLARAAIGPLDGLRESWNQSDSAAQERNLRKGRRWPVFWAALEQLRSSDQETRELGVLGLQKAMDEGELAVAAWELGKYFQRTDPSRARDFYKKGGELGDPYCYCERGHLFREEAEALLDQGEDRQAEQKLRLARDDYELALDQGEPMAAHSLGLLFERHECLKGDSRAAYLRGVALRDPLSVYWLADSYREPDRDTGAQPDLEKAAALYRFALELGERSAAISLGRLLTQLGDLGEAERVLQIGVRLHDVESALELGRMYKAQQRLESSIAAYRRAVELAQFEVLSRRGDPGDQGGQEDSFLTEGAWELGQLFEAQGHVPAARGMYRLALEAGGKRSVQWAGKAALREADLALQEGDTEVAERALKRGLELGSAAAGVRLGRLLEERSERSETIAAVLEEALVAEEEGPYADRTGEAGLWLGRHFRKRGRSSDAAAALRRAIELGSEVAESELVDLLEMSWLEEVGLEVAKGHRRWASTDTAVRLARLLEENGCREAAIAVLADLYSTDAAAYLESGRLLQKMGETDRAENAYRSAMSRGSGEAAHRLGRMLSERGDKPGAEYAGREAARLGYPDADG